MGTSLLAGAAGGGGGGGGLSEAAVRVLASAQAFEFDQSMIPSPATLRSGATVAVTTGAGGQFDAGLVEGGTVFFDPAANKLTMVYVGYDKDVNTFASTTVASVGYATSDDGLTWTKQGQLFTASGTPGAADQNGTTGPVMVVSGGLYHLFYIGLTAVGYEGGERAICHATKPVATGLAGGSWTRQGAVISKSTDPNSWRWFAVWHPNIVYTNGKWYLFFNASGKVGAQNNTETIGYATAATLDGPWAIDDTNSPVLTAVTAGDTVVGDPYVWRLDADTWRMDVYRADSTGTTIGAYYATTSVKDFPLGWKHRGQVTSAVANQGAKPYAIRFNGRIYYYASFGVNIFVSVAPDITNQAQTVDQPWRFNGGTAGQPNLKVGDDSTLSLGTAKHLSVRGSTVNSQFAMGQSNSNMLLTTWQYNATASAAVAKIETFGGSNALQIANSSGAVAIGNNTSGMQVATGARLRSGSGAPAVAGTLGDWFLRTDTPTVANQRLYICTTAGAAGVAVWTGVL